MKTLVELSLAVEHRRGHGALYAALDRGWLEPARLRRTLAGLPLPKAADGRIVLAVDVSNWLRPDAATSDDRLFCHVYGRGDRRTDQLVPGRPYSFVAALETGRTSWCALLDAVRLGPADDATAVTATQLRDVVARLMREGHWHAGDPEILIVMDSAYDVTYLSHAMADLPVVLVGRLRSDRVMLRDPGPTGAAPRAAGRAGTAASSQTVMSFTAPWMITASLKPWSTSAFSRRIPHRSAAWSSRAMPASLSCALAARTTTPMTRPSTSTASPRFPPGVFLFASSPVSSFGTPAATRTDWVSMITRDGSSNRRARSRTWQRRISWIRWSRPSWRHRVK